MEDQTPPAVASASVIVDPTHTAAAPVILPAINGDFTINIAAVDVSEAVPCVAMPLYLYPLNAREEVIVSVSFVVPE
jgi:hypothetical protein